MIGNDVVDLALAKKDSNWERPGFLPKIYTLHEQQLIRSSANPELAVWNLWSRKEAAYKVFARQHKIRRFMPLHFECCDLEATSEVRCSDYSFYTSTEVRGDLIHTVAVSLQENLQKIIALPTDIEITKVGDLPFLHKDDELMPVSVSHHGRYHRVVTLAI